MSKRGQLYYTAYQKELIILGMFHGTLLDFDPLYKVPVALTYNYLYQNLSMRDGSSFTLFESLWQDDQFGTILRDIFSMLQCFDPA